jgi:lactate permease
VEAPPANAPTPPGAWTQVYEPHGWPWWAAALVAALPVATLFYFLAVRKSSAPRAAFAGALTAVLVAILFTGMPAGMALSAFALGAAFGLFPICWVVFAALFLYQIAVDTGQFAVMKSSIARLTADRRLQVLLIAFAFGAVIEGAAGFGTPVAISAALLVGLGFRPFLAAVLCLIANTAPVAWGSVGTPLITLATVSGLPLNDLSAMNARILPITSVIVPIWLVRAMVPWRETLEVLPAALVCGGSFAAAQFLWGNYLNVGLVDIVAGLFALASLALFLLVWKPKRVWRFPEETAEGTAVEPASAGRHGAGAAFRAWLPFLILFACVIGWGLLRDRMNRVPGAVLQVPVRSLEVVRTRPVVPEDRIEEAVFKLNWLSATGTGGLLACLLTSVALGQRPRELSRSFRAACRRMRVPLLAIVPMLGLAYVCRYSGIDAILGLAFTRTGVCYPFFGTFLGWLGVALTGSDTSSNALFGSLQRITAEQLRLDPILMCSANSAGGVMGKMVDAQSIVVATAASGQVGSEGKILLAVLWHSIALAAVVALIVVAYAYAVPAWVPHGVQLLFD